MSYYKDKYLKYKLKYLLLKGGSKCTNCNPRHLITLSGIKHCVLFENIFGRKILLLGEQHSTGSLCKVNADSQSQIYDVHTWINDLAIIAPSPIDIFTESQYIPLSMDKHVTEEKYEPNSPLETYKSPLDAVEEILDNDIITKLPNLRRHRIDIRSPSNIKYPIAIMITNFHKQFQKTMTEYSPSDIKNMFKYVIKGDIIGKQIHEEMMRRVIKFLLYNLPMEGIWTYWGLHANEEEIFEMSNKILKFWQNNILDDINNLDISVPRTIRMYDKETNILDVIIELYMVTQVLAPDGPLYDGLYDFALEVHTLLKIFSKPIDTNMKNIIVHTGSFHTQFFMTFIQMLSSKFSTFSYLYSQQCIHFENPFDFFM